MEKLIKSIFIFLIFISLFFIWFFQINALNIVSDPWNNLKINWFNTAYSSWYISQGDGWDCGHGSTSISILTMSGVELWNTNSFNNTICDYFWRNGNWIHLINVINNRYIFFQNWGWFGHNYAGNNTVDFLFDTYDNTFKFLSEKNELTVDFTDTFYWSSLEYAKIFFSDNNVFIYNWTLINKYDFDWNFIESFSKPSVNFDLKYWTLPIYLEGNNWTHFFVYTWTDNNLYKVLDDFSSWSDLLLDTDNIQNSIAFWPFFDNDIVISKQIVWSWNIYIENSKTWLPLYNFWSWFKFTRLAFFENPKIYFNTTTANEVVSWDMNCKTEWFDKCINFSGIFKCADSENNLSTNWELCWDLIIPLAWNCTDWIQNQDETWIDEGGVCAIVLPTTVPPVSVWWCEEKTFFEWDPNLYNIWNWTYSDQSSTWWTYTNFQWNWLNDWNSYMDRFSVYPFYEWTLINSDTFTWWIDADINTTFVNWWLKTSLSVSLSRTWSVAYINYVKVKTTESWQSMPYSDYDNVIANVDFIWQDWSKNSFPLIYSWWYATAFSNVLAKNIKITWLQNLTISWFEVWKSNSTPIIKYNCKDFVYNCWWIEQGPGNFDCKLLWSLQGFDFHCVINWNACEPLPWIWWSWGTIIPPTPNIDLLYDYWSWFSLSWSVRGINLKTEDIFSCIDKETGEELTGFSVLWCPFIIVWNIWDKFTSFSQTIINILYNVSNIWSPSWTWWQIFWFLFNTASAESIDLKIPFNYTSTGQLKDDVAYTWTELGWFNKSFYDSMNNTKNLQDWWIKSIYSYAIWFLILISLVTVIALFFWGLSN